MSVAACLWFEREAEEAARVFAAMQGMVKLDVAGLERAAAG